MHVSRACSLSDTKWSCWSQQATRQFTQLPHTRTKFTSLRSRNTKLQAHSSSSTINTYPAAAAAAASTCQSVIPTYHAWSLRAATGCKLTPRARGARYYLAAKGRHIGTRELQKPRAHQSLAAELSPLVRVWPIMCQRRFPFSTPLCIHGESLPWLHRHTRTQTNTRRREINSATRDVGVTNEARTRR